MMDFAEEMIKESVQKAVGNLQVKYGEKKIDFSNFERLSMKDAIIRYWQNDWRKIEEIILDENSIEDLSFLKVVANYLKKLSVSKPFASRAFFTSVEKIDEIKYLSSFFNVRKDGKNQ
jgi:lysyl-tRNA synthetase class II